MALLAFVVASPLEGQKNFRRGVNDAGQAFTKLARICRLNASAFGNSKRARSLIRQEGMLVFNGVLS